MAERDDHVGRRDQVLGAEIGEEQPGLDAVLTSGSPQGLGVGYDDLLATAESDAAAAAPYNAAICERLHLSVKTVEPAVGSVFAKLQLHQQPDTNRHGAKA